MPLSPGLVIAVPDANVMISLGLYGQDFILSFVMQEEEEEEEILGSDDDEQEAPSDYCKVENL